MTAIEIATGIIDKLQAENRVCLETLHKAQDTIKYSERQIAEKDRLIKVLEERLRTGTDGLLEMTNRQKDLTIKHLELQIQKLLKENEDLEVRLEAIKAEICPKCETKLLLSENIENKSLPKSHKPPGKSSNILFEKKSSQIASPNRLKALEKIVEHKDKRIMHLSKEVQRLLKLEKELTQKVYRLTKLLPMSRLPPETVTECLLKEIQLLEAQKEGCKSNCDKQLFDNLSKMKKDIPLTSQATINKPYVFKSSDRLKKSAASNLKVSAASSSRSEQIVFPDGVENEVLFRKLQKLCNDINELKRLFAFESEKLSYGLNSTANEYNLFKLHLEEIINNLNDVMQNILSNDFNLQQNVLKDSSISSDDKYVISCLQERLKESLGMVTEYENENKALKDSLDKLKSQMDKQCTCSVSKSEDKIYKSYSDSSQIQNINDIKKLREIVKIKETQLEASQKFIEELQKSLKHSTSEKVCCSTSVEEGQIKNSFEQENKKLQTKLDVAEKNIRTCETVIEELQDSICRLEEENVRLESELHKEKSKAISDQQDSFLYTKMSSSDTHINILKKFNQELQDKIKVLEETNSKLETNAKLHEIKSISLEAAEQEKTLLKSKLDASEKHICSLEKSIETLQNKLKIVESEKNKLESDLKEITLKNNLAETYENDVMALKTELVLKEEENKELKESLHTLENKAVEMNHYRKSLHKEIENLCKVLMENENMEDSARRKAIYKAAVLHSAQALLRLDDNYNLKPEDSGRNSALEEIKHQIEVYLTEVARIHELVTIKEQERDELLKDYLDLPDDATLRPSPSLRHESRVQGQASDDDLQSFPNLNAFKTIDPASSKQTSNLQKSPKFHYFETATELKNLQEELAATKSVTTYLLSSCTRLEDLLSKERTERAKAEIELHICQETIKDLKAQLSMKNNMTKRLNTLIEMMRSKECNDEITLEQLKSEIKWLVDENQKIFEKVTATQSELCQCKEENCRVQNDLDSMKRQLLNEKYENAKISNELKHLRSQISNSQSMASHEDS